jgi:CMP-N-acetylneuraminic acid synthetase
MSIICIIPARGGSKGVKNKNLIKIGDFTLVERALFTAIGVSRLERIIVSSDSDEIIKLVNQYGEYAPFKRPPELATDEAGSLGVIQHALKWAESEDDKKYKYIVLLEPPCPFRLPEHVIQGLEIAVGNDVTSVMSLVEVGDHHPIRMKRMDNNGALTGFVMEEPDGLRRQDQEPAYIRNCAVSVLTRKNMKSNVLWGDKPFGFEMDNNLYSINIDNPLDVLTSNIFYNEMKLTQRLDKIEQIPYIN